MNAENTLIAASSLCLLMAVFLIFFKFHYLKRFQKNYHRYVRVRIFGIYKVEDIYSTTSIKKKGFMITCNRITTAIYACLVPVSLYLTLFLVFKIVALLDSIQ